MIGVIVLLLRLLGRLLLASFFLVWFLVGPLAVEMYTLIGGWRRVSINVPSLQWVGWVGGVTLREECGKLCSAMHWEPLLDGNLVWELRWQVYWP